MPVAADTHVHIYPNHDLGVFFSSSLSNLAGLAPPDKVPDTARVLCLTEGEGHHAYQELREGRRAMPEGFAVTPTSDPGALRVDHDTASLFLVAGRQIVTAERLEVLALAVEADLPDGRPLSETLDEVRNADGIPVLAWAPGKWFGARGGVVRALLDEAEPGSLWLGDTSMRPTGWLEPLLMKRGRQNGLALIAGSDPLPQPGEEAYPGTYGIFSEAPFDTDRPARNMRDLLRAGDRFVLRGRRCGPVEMAGRWNRHRKSKGS